MFELARSHGPRFTAMAEEQDAIGWRRFMEGMIGTKLVEIQSEFMDFGDTRAGLATWAKGLVTQLLETTHGQWLYRNVHVHDEVSGIAATKRKEVLQKEIEDQLR